ncbi:MAG: NAD(P)H-hydrate dehydratase [Cellvibrionaceae bacterium]
MKEQLFTVAQAREFDRLAIEEFNIPGLVLMKRAGTCVFNTLLQQWPQTALKSDQQITVFCGAGNNGGDGYVVAGLAAQKNLPVRVVFLSPPEELTGDAKKAFYFAQEAGVSMMAYEKGMQFEQGVIVDALFGIGLSREVEGDYLDAIGEINKSGLPIIAVDVPSGLSANSGAILGDCVDADVTATFIARKRGLYTGQAPSKVGEIVFDSLIDEPIYDAIQEKMLTGQDVVIESIHFADSVYMLPPRPANAHKGHFGHTLVIGGDNGMGGAVMMAAEAVARIGSGLVSVATRVEHVAPLLTRRPELMVSGVESSDDMLPLLAKATVIVVGPGLGQSDWSKQLLKMAMMSELPMVIDADALNLVAALSEKEALVSHRWVLTPHPGEAARLLGVTVADIASDRFNAVTELQRKYGGVVVLKGAGSLVASSQAIHEKNITSIAINKTGNPGMATGGMGDVLSGILGGLIAQKLSLKDAAELGVALHGAAADKAVQVNGEKGLLATDLYPHMRRLINVKESTKR